MSQRMKFPAETFDIAYQKLKEHPGATFELVNKKRGTIVIHECPSDTVRKIVNDYKGEFVEDAHYAPFISAHPD